jgi:hypothetical protein
MFRLLRTGRLYPIYLLSAAIAIGMGCSGDDNRGTTNAVAWVAERPITRTMLDQRFEALRGPQSRIPQLTFSRREVLASLIRDEWYRQEAIAQGAAVPRSTDQNYERQQVLILEELQRRVLSRRRVTPSLTELRAYFRAHLDEFRRPANRLTVVIGARDLNLASLARRALIRGRSPIIVRQQYSQGVQPLTQDRAGLISVTAGRGQLPTALERAIFRVRAAGIYDPKTRETPLKAASPTLIHGPVKARGIWYVFRIYVATEEVPATFSAARGKVANDLAVLSDARFFERYLRTLAAKYIERTRCASDLVVQQCNQNR